MNFKVKGGVYPTMITPYKNGEIDYEAVEKLVEWYWNEGCDAPTIRKRIEICKGSNLKIFNANAQTMLESWRDGAYGYCGVMANFHPSLYVRLLKENNDVLQGYLGLSAMLENLTYPCCAKYFLDKHVGIKMEIYARSADEKNFTDYQKSCIDQFAILDKAIAERI